MRLLYLWDISGAIYKEHYRDQNQKPIMDEYSEI